MNRRDFFRAVALAAFAAKFGKVDSLLANDSVPFDPNIVAIFSDAHLKEPETIQSVVLFNKCVEHIIAMNPRPAKLLIYGDIAWDAGRVEDYELFKKLIAPIEKAGIVWETAMGNHDRLGNYRKVFPERFEKPQPVDGRLVNIVETPNADFILLDSYLEGEVRGAISDEQKTWLAEIVKKYDSKPFFVGCHHPLKETGLEDLLKSCPKFAAFLHGHYHYYRSPVQEEIQTICFPSTGLWGDLGFAIASITEEEAVFAPHIDGYMWPTWGNVKDRVENVEEYIAKLNENSPVVRFKK